MNKIKLLTLLSLICFTSTNAQDTLMFKSKGNPVIRHKFTSDPSALVYKDTLYIYASQDNTEGSFAENDPQNWLVFSSADLQIWTEHPIPLTKESFKWAAHEEQAWASHVVEKNGKFYWYACIGNGYNKSIGVAVADHPAGPYVDAIKKPLITGGMTSSPKKWGDVDPMVFIDDDGQAYLFWGGGQCFYAKLKDNMTELDGEIEQIDLPSFHTSPWVHKHDDWYYLSYGYGVPTMTAYHRSKSITGPWEDCGLLNRRVQNSVTNQHAIIEFKNDWLFIYHNGAIPFIGGDLKRSVCIDRLYYKEDGTIEKIKMTKEGVCNTPEEKDLMKNI
ncbi:MAG: family 43 glycosylhydrolase [Dysgonomonas sp.]|nr:family 43 glycosylhydrolase [Dysgonomonas sp.]